MGEARVRRTSNRRYPRTARVNESLREVIAEEVERIDDLRLGLVTITGVTTEPDLRHATVFFSSLADDAGAGLADHRVRLQAAIGRQLRLKRTPELVFRADPAIATGRKVEDILRALRDTEREPERVEGNEEP